VACIAILVHISDGYGLTDMEVSNPKQPEHMSLLATPAIASRDSYFTKNLRFYHGFNKPAPIQS